MALHRPGYHHSTHLLPGFRVLAWPSNFTQEVVLLCGGARPRRQADANSRTGGHYLEDVQVYALQTNVVDLRPLLHVRAPEPPWKRLFL